MMNDILILEGARTPFCTWAGGTRADGEKGGTFKPVEVPDLGGAALKEALSRAALQPSAVQRVLFGNTYAVGAQATYAARHVAYRAGVPPEVPGFTVTAACASGLQAVVEAAGAIRLGEAAVAAAAGADNCSLVARNVFVPSFKEMMCGRQIAEVSQDMSKEYGFSRADQDRFALQSHRRAADARTRGVFKEEIVPVDGVERDDAIMEEPAPQRFAESKVLFEGYEATAANTHAVVDGGAAVLLASPEGAKRAGKPPLGRLVSTALVGVPSDRMPYASAAAVREALSKAGWGLGDVDLFEINETFASQMLVAVKELGLSEDRVNVNGGAIALGHPFGATGPRLVYTLLRELKRRGLKRGVAAICAGGGTGVAVAVEAL